MLLTRGGSPDSCIAQPEDSPVLAVGSQVCRTITALLFLATTVNYMDRAVLGVSKALLDAELGWTIAATAGSFAAGAHALAHTVIGFVIVRSLLGLAEGGFFAAAVKAVAEWFPQQERAFATGLFNQAVTREPFSVRRCAVPGGSMGLVEPH